MDKKEKELRDHYCELEYLAEIEMSESRKSTTNEERNEHIINAMIAEDAATYLVTHYRGGL